MLGVILVIITVIGLGLIWISIFSDNDYIGFVGVVIMILCLTIRITYDLSYKQGQIDILTGNIKYELKTNPDSTKTWEKIDE